MFGNVFQNTPSRRPLRIIKVAASATSLVHNWSKKNGLIWPQLVERIRATIDTDTEEWKAIVWFQGETDSLSNATAVGYRVELTKFIANVRKQMHVVDSTTFSQPFDIPVVIVGLGCWAATQTYGPIVIKAQRNFVALTPNTVLVPTNDLSCDKHYDDASQLIIGARVANALKILLSTPTKVPTRRPTKIPTRKPTLKPISRSKEVAKLTIPPRLRRRGFLQPRTAPRV